MSLKPSCNDECFNFSNYCLGFCFKPCRLCSVYKLRKDHPFKTLRLLRIDLLIKQIIIDIKLLQRKFIGNGKGQNESDDNAFDKRRVKSLNPMKPFSHQAGLEPVY